MAQDSVKAMGVEQSLVGSVDRSDGMKQLTLAGRPLYRYMGNAKAGEMKGQTKDSKWYAVTPPARRPRCPRTAPVRPTAPRAGPVRLTIWRGCPAYPDAQQCRTWRHLAPHRRQSGRLAAGPQQSRSRAAAGPQQGCQVLASELPGDPPTAIHHPHRPVERSWKCVRLRNGSGGHPHPHALRALAARQAPSPTGGTSEHPMRWLRRLVRRRMRHLRLQRRLGRACGDSLRETALTAQAPGPGVAAVGSVPNPGALTGSPCRRGVHGAERSERRPTR